MLWSDPVADPGLELNEQRGVGTVFGPDITEVHRLASPVHPVTRFLSQTGLVCAWFWSMYHRRQRASCLEPGFHLKALCQPCLHPSGHCIQQNNVLAMFSLASLCSSPIAPGLLILSQYAVMLSFSLQPC